MAAHLEEMMENVISIITNDGRNIIGVLKGYDQCINIILEQSIQRVFSSKTGVESVELGLYIVRGDNIAVIGEVDEAIDSKINYDRIRADPLKPVVH